MTKIQSTRHQSFLKHAAIYGVGTVLLQGASALLLPLYTYYLNPADFGILEVINRTGELFQIIFMANGIRLAALTFYKQTEPGPEQDRVVPTVVMLVFILLLTGGIIAFVLCIPIAGLIGVGKPDLLFFGMVAVLLNATTAVPLALIQARVESLHFIVIGLSMLVVRVTLLVITLVCFGWGVWGVFGANALTLGGFGLFLTFKELRKSSFIPELSRIPQVARFVIPFVPTGLCFFVLQNGDRFFLLRNVGEAEVGVYSLAYRLALAVGTLAVVPFRRVWTARMFDEYASSNGPQTVGHAVRGLLAVYLFAGVGLCVLREQLVGLLAPSGYMSASILIVPLSFAMFFWNASNYTEGSLYAFHRTTLKPLIAVFSTGLIVLLYALMIPRFGTMGAAFATLIGFVFHATLTYFVTQRVFVVKYSLWRIFGMLSLAILTVAVAEFFPSSFLGVGAKICIWLIWPVIVWWVGLLDYQEKYWVRQQLNTSIRFAKRKILPTIKCVP